MASTQTLTNLKQVLEDNNFSGMKTFDDRIHERACIHGLAMLHEARSWSFHRSDHLVQTEGSTSLTISGTLSAGSTTVTTTGSPFAAGDVGKFIEFDGQQQAYEIASFTDANNVELRFAYQGSNMTSSNTVLMVTRDYAIPQQVNTVYEIIVENGITIPSKVEPNELIFRHSRDSGVGQPTLYAIMSENAPTSAANKKFMSFYQYPNAVLEYTLLYHRTPGWFDATTGAWKALPTANTDIVDWPDEKITILHKAILLALAENNEVPDRFYSKARSAYFSKLALAMSRDEEEAIRTRLGKRSMNDRIHGTLDRVTGQITAQS